MLQQSRPSSARLSNLSPDEELRRAREAGAKAPAAGASAMGQRVVIFNTPICDEPARCDSNHRRS